MIRLLMSIWILVSLLWAQLVHAHPLDISVSTGSISGSSISVTTYFHSYEIEYLLRQNDKLLINGVADYFVHQDIIADYVQNNSSLTNNGVSCEISQIEVLKDEIYIILSDGLGVSYRFDCEEDIKDIQLELAYFIEFPLQTNRITLYHLTSGIKWASPLLYKVLTAKKPYLNLNIYETDHIVHLDSDDDGLSDEDEKIYATDPYNPDSDGDYFSDKEEVEYGWNPLNSEMWPEQYPRNEFDPNLSLEQVDKLQNIMWEVSEKNLWDFSPGWNGVLKKTMKYINDFFEKNEGNIAGIFWFVFLLGVIHTLWPGHSKWLLISYTLEKKNGYAKWFLFAAVFTITHILDIILLVFVARMLSWVVQSHYTTVIQWASAALLFIFWVYLVYKSIRSLRASQGKSDSRPQTSLWIAFLAWLAPCSFAWSIFLLLGALWKPSWIIPLVLALWAGIFTTLCLIVLMSVFLKNRMYQRVKSLWIYSGLFSAVMILSVSVVMIWRVF